MKGWETDVVKLKSEEASKRYKNYKVCYTVSELKMYINEF